MKKFSVEDVLNYRWQYTGPVMRMDNPFAAPPAPPAEPTAREKELQEALDKISKEKDELLTKLFNEPPGPGPADAPNPAPPKPPAAPPAAPPPVGPTATDQTVIEGARLIVASRFPDFATFAGEVDAIMARMPIDNRKSHIVWAEVYYNVKGRHADEIRDKAVSAALKPTGPERPTPPAPTLEDKMEFESPQEEIIFNNLVSAAGTSRVVGTDGKPKDLPQITKEGWFRNKKAIKENGGIWQLPIT